MPPKDEALASLLLETMPRLMQELRRPLEGRDLTLAQMRALRFVGRNEGASISALAERLGLSLPSASKLVQSLVDADLLERAPSEADRRQAELRLTASAKAEWRKARDAFRESLAQRLGRLSPAERARLEEGLRGLARVLDEG